MSFDVILSSVCSLEGINPLHGRGITEFSSIARNASPDEVLSFCSVFSVVVSDAFFMLPKIGSLPLDGDLNVSFRPGDDKLLVGEESWSNMASDTCLFRVLTEIESCGGCDVFVAEKSSFCPCLG